MKAPLIILFFLTFIFSCKKPPIDNSSSTVNDCKSVPALRFQNISDSLNATTVSEMAGEIAAAAKTTAIASKTAPVDASGSAKLSADLSRKVSQVLVQSSTVQQDFWQQDIVFRQVLCFLETQSFRKDIPQAHKDKIHSAMLELASARSQYSLEWEKKNGQPQN